MCSGTPRRMNRSESTSMTSIDLSRRDTRMARHSWVNSSMMLSMRNLRPSCVLAETRPDSRCWLFDPCGTYHPFSSSHQFLLCERERVKKGLHRGLAEAPAALMRPLLVVVDEPGIEIGLQFLDRAIDLFTERHPIEL